MDRLQIDLRPATVTDRDFAFQVWKAAMQQYVKATWGWNEASQLQRQQEEFDVVTYQIVRIAEQSAGTLIIKRHPDHLYLSGLYLLPEYQRQGIGSQVLASLLDEARVQSKIIRLRVLKVNPQARRLYERMGFVVTDETEQDFICMESA